MNEYNHHRIINRFVVSNNKNNISMPSNIRQIFEDASDFTDSINAEGKYFFYHFYYDIDIDGNVIRLSRNDEHYNLNHSKYSMDCCGEFVGYDYNLRYIMPFNSKTDEKEFFSFINDRPKSRKLEIADIGNQSDNVAFLHAMGSIITEIDGASIGEGTSNSKKIFIEHLKKCFAEYLFIDDEDQALFILGIAMHGIMDSFTPSHMNFQYYTKQDMALHAQGDVIPIRTVTIVERKANPWDIYTNETKIDYELEDEAVGFVPGQYDKDSFVAQVLFKLKKGYDDNSYINDIEFEMLKIFLDISKLQNVSTNSLLMDLKNKKLDEIKTVLSQYKYGDEAYIYGECAIKAMTDVYTYLSEKRNSIQKNYSRYKENILKQNKQVNTTIEEAVKIWEDIYDGKVEVIGMNIKKIREEHLKKDFYSKKKGDAIRNHMREKLNINYQTDLS